MKKFYRAATVLLAAAILLSLSCFAGHSEALADELHSMNMFKGTDQGYELDKVPTRAEAAVMLVRLLGQEENAKAAYAKGDIKHPYVDAPAEWIAPSVAYLHNNGLTNGMGKNEQGAPLFGMQGPCSAQMYCAFLLRALGYSDMGAQPDFTYANAIDFAKEKGIVEDLLLAETFTRDVMVAASYQALSRPVKDGSGLLLENLIASGAIDASAAEPTLRKMKAFQAMNTVSIDEATTSFDAVMDTKIELGAPLNMTNYMTMQMKFIYDAQPQLEMALTSDDGTNKVQVRIWFKDGWMYMDDGTGNKVKTQVASIDELTDTFGQETPMQSNTFLYMFSDLTNGTDAKGDYYQLHMSPRFYTALNQSIVETMADSGLAMSFDNVEVRVYLNADSSVQSMEMTMDLTMSTEGTDIPMSIAYTMTINATGDQVVISYPDLSQFIAQ